MKKKNIDYLILPIFKIYNKAVTVKTVWHLHKTRQIAQWNRIESPEKHMHGQTILNKGAKINQKRKVFLTNGAQKTGNPHAKKKKNLDPYFIPYTKINSNVKTYMLDSEL